MQVLQFVVNHWGAILAGVSETMGLFGLGGVLKQIVDVLKAGSQNPPAQPKTA